jgi:type II secretory pathway pseudopilin PulG
MFFYKRKKKGAALATILMVFAVLSILGTTMLSVSLSENKQVTRQENNIQAYYAARAGADAMASYIIDNPGKVGEMISKTSSIPGKGAFNGVNFEVKVIKDAITGELTIQSTGRANNMASSSVNLTLSKTSGEVFKQTLFTDGPLNLGNNTTVYGDIGTNSMDDVSFGNNKSKLNGNLFLGPEAIQDASGKYIGVDYNAILGKVEKLADENVFPLIDESKFIESYATITGSQIIDVTNQKRYIKVGKIDIGGSNNVVIRGKGELHILITGSMKMSGNSTFYTEGGAKVFLYYLGSQDLDIRGGSRFEGAIYSPNAAVEWKGGGNEIIRGSIMARSFTGASSNTQIIYDETLNNMVFPILGAEGYKRKQWSSQ